MPGADFEKFIARASHRYAGSTHELLQRYARAYGSSIDRLLAGCSSMADLGDAVLPGLYAREIDYLRREEFAIGAEDILYRRSKLGVHLGKDSVATLDAHLRRLPSPA